MQHLGLLVRSGDTHPAHTLTYYAALGLTPEQQQWLLDNFDPTHRGVPFCENLEVHQHAGGHLSVQPAPVFFLDDTMNSTVAREFADRQGIWEFFRQIDPNAKVQVISPELEALLEDDDDCLLNNSLELYHEGEILVQYLHYNQPQANAEKLFRFWTKLEPSDEFEDETGAGWSVYTEWIPLSLFK